MKTNEDSNAAGFGQLLRHELLDRLLWIEAVSVAVIAWNINQSGVIGVMHFVALCILLALITSTLVRRTPWCSDTAFWRTRPISRATLFFVKSTAIVILCVIPIVAVTVIGVSGFDSATRTAVISLVMVTVIAVTTAVAAAVAIGSAGVRLLAFSWQAVFVVPVLSWVALIVARRYFDIPLARGGGIEISGMLVGFSVAAFGAIAAWVTVGMTGKAKAAVVILIVVGLVWPWFVGTFQGDFFKSSEPVKVALKVERGESVLRMPIKVGPMAEGEWFVPKSLQVQWKSRPDDDVSSESYDQRGSGFPLSPTSEVQVFTQDHRDFTDVVNVEKLWEIPRSEVPMHEHWIPAEETQAVRATGFVQLEPDVFSSPDALLSMSGFCYRFLSIDPVKPERRVIAFNDYCRLEITKVGVANAYSIDVSVKMTSSVLKGANHWKYVTSVRPPELWGILYHEESMTAYGTASSKGRQMQDRLAEMFIQESDLTLRFELPRMESALLGVDPVKVLDESVLYLFVVEGLGPASAK